MPNPESSPLFKTDYYARKHSESENSTNFGPTVAHSDDVDQSFRFDADQIGAKRRKALSV